MSFRFLPVPGLLLSILLPLFSSPVTAAPVSAGDRNKVMNIVLPDKAFKSNNNRGNFINLKEAPYHAKGDGVTDDTQAFVALFNFLRDKLAENRGEGERGGHNFQVFLPAGTYLVSDSLIHEGSIKRGFCYLRLWGENRATTVIKLKDNAPGFQDPSKPKTVLPWTKNDQAQGNIMWGNHARNFTIDTGRGNPGAAGMTFLGANGSAIENVTIRSGDGAGVVGLWFPWWSVQGHYTDITVEGFNHGIKFDDSREIHPVLENVTLKGQRVAALDLGPATAASIRKLLSVNTVPAITMNGKASHLVMVESLLQGGIPGTSAIVFNNSEKQEVFLRDVGVSGYDTSLTRDGKPELKGNITEYVSGDVVVLSASSPRKSMNLPVPDVSLVEWEQNPANFANPEDYEGTPEEKIRQALNSGKPAVVFTRTYSIHKPEVELEIPATVTQILTLGQPAVIRPPFVIRAGNKPLWIDGPVGSWEFRVEGSRPVHIRNGSIKLGFGENSGGQVMVDNISVLRDANSPTFCPKGARVYARSINEEARAHPNFVSSGGLLWVLGYKTEAAQSAFVVNNGGILEVLGGYQNMAAVADANLPKLFNNGGNVSYVGTTFMSRGYKNAIWEAVGATTKKIMAKDLPQRGTAQGNYYVPLYSGYDPKVVQAAKAGN